MQPSKLNHVKAVYFCYFAAMAGFAPFLALYYAQLGLASHEIGLLASISPVVTLIAAPLWGAWADATHRHRLLLLSAIGATLVSIALFLLARTLYQLIPMVILYALVLAPIMPLIDNSVFTLLGSERHRYGRLRLWGALGWGVVGTVAGLLVERFGLKISFYMFFVFMSGLWITAFFLPVSTSSIGNRFWQGARDLFGDFQWIVLLMAVFSSSVAMSVTNNYLFLYLDTLGASKALMGYSLAVATLSELPVFFFADRLLKRFGSRNLLVIAIVAQIIRSFAYAALPAPWLVLPINLLHGLTFSAMWSAGVARANELAAPKGLMTTAQGMLGGTTMGLGGLVGALLGGALFAQVGPVALFTVAGLGTMVGLVFFVLAGRNPSAVPWKSESVG